MATEYTATKNWFQSPNNNAGGTWGGCASKIIGPNGELCIVLDDNQIPHYSAGYGGLGPPTEFLVDDYAISYEFAQPNNGVAFTDAQYARGAIEIAKDCRNHGIPPVMLDLRPSALGQRYPVPTGITRHDWTANGVKLVKTDPGKMWDDAKFIALLIAELEDDMALTPDQAANIALIPVILKALGYGGDGQKGTVYLDELPLWLNRVLGTRTVDDPNDEMPNATLIATIKQAITEAIAAGGIDYAKLAKAVNDDAAERMKA